LHVVNFDQLYAFLKQNEKDAKEVQEMRQRFLDPLALLANTYNVPPSYISQNIKALSNLRTQATIQNGQVTVQNVQRRQPQGYVGNAGKSQATGARVVNTVEDAGENQPRVMICYNFKGAGHIAKQCITKKRVKDSEWFKDKMLLTQAQEAGVVFVIADKQAGDLHVVNFDQLYAFLKQNEKDAKEVQEMRQRFLDPLALLANTYNVPPSYISQNIKYHS
nr:hypothetical protein [Tanacetum cinerariifolium]